MSFMSNECGKSLSISQKFRQSAQELKSVRTDVSCTVKNAPSFAPLRLRV